MNAQSPPAILVLMGVSGSGKTTVAQVLAERLGWRLVEGDDLHPPANVAKMHSGIPLEDADRWPWLDAIAALIREWRAADGHGLITCSALKKSYRQRLTGGEPGVCFVYLKGSRDLLGQRLAARRGHFMPASLLDSQFATLQEPEADEPAVVVDVSGDPESIAAEVIRRLGLEKV
jgi:carbohydrate kinase (thermoresistant glucokinase family)